MTECIRDVRVSDACRISEIYRPYVENTTITFETEAPDEKEMERRILSHSEYPYIVMEADGRVIGYAYAGPFKERRAYRPTTEISVYLEEGYTGQGRGERLTREILSQLTKDDRYFVCLACITSPNPRSEKLFERLGFECVGIYENVGYKMGAWLGVKDYVLPLKPFDRAPVMK
ncbi:MAG: N-acetyltransferase [Clostridia bacterium]|nr:N-acetyltransferase [Clostridia bacterium]